MTEFSVLWASCCSSEHKQFHGFLAPNSFSQIFYFRLLPDFLTFTSHILLGSFADPDPSDPYVFWPPGSGSGSQRYGSGSFYQAKILRKTLITTVS
jgi:hypothetical protein